MTTIAWDGKTLAADKQATDNDLRRSVTKIFKHKKMLLAVSGSLAKGLELVRWAERGFVPEEHPALDDEEAGANLLVVSRTGPRLRLFNCGSIEPFCPEDRIFAMGSGRDFATMAMFLGKTSAEAVLLAAEFDVNTGMGVDTLTL